MSSRTVTTVCVLAAISAALVPAAWGARKPVVKPPSSGAKYTGVTDDKQKVSLFPSGKALQIFALDFVCVGKVVGSTSLEAIKLTRTDTGYKFSIRAHGIVSYKDGKADENAAINVSGRFSRSARSVTGRVRVRSPRCRSTAFHDWHAAKRGRA
jgi:hypothetical protein